MTTPDSELVSLLRVYGRSDIAIQRAADRIEALTKERDEAVLHAGRCSLNACALDARNREAKKLREEVETLTKDLAFTVHDRDETRAAFELAQGRLSKCLDTIEALTKERDEARAAVPALEATVKRLEVAYNNATGDRDAAHDSRNRMLESVRSALGCEPGQGVVWKANELRKERDEAWSDAQSARIKWTQDIQDIRIQIGAYSHEDTFAAAKRIVRERNEARSRIDAWSLRYDALFAQSIHIAREVDRLNSEKADRKVST